MQNDPPLQLVGNVEMNQELETIFSYRPSFFLLHNCNSVMNGVFRVLLAFSPVKYFPSSRAAAKVPILSTVKSLALSMVCCNGSHSIHICRVSKLMDKR